MATLEDDEDTAVATADVPDDEDDDDDDEDEDEDEATGNDENAYAAYEGRIRRTGAKRLKTYREKMTASLNTRITDYAKKIEENITSKLDEWTMKHAGAGQVQNPQRVAESLLRQNAAAEVRHAAIRAQLAQLEAAGVDIDAVKAAMEAPAAAAATA